MHHKTTGCDVLDFGFTITVKLPQKDLRVAESPINSIRGMFT